VKNQFTKLAKRITTELVLLDQIVSRCEEALRRSKLSSDDLYLDSVALNLENFYSGIERLLQLIATTLDGRVPRGEEWHKALLEQMCSQVSGIRPAVLSETSKTMLDEFRRVRHVVRVIYTFTLEPKRLEELTEKLRPTFSIVRRELEAFAGLLEQRARGG